MVVSFAYVRFVKVLLLYVVFIMFRRIVFFMMQLMVVVKMAGVRIYFWRILDLILKRFVIFLFIRIQLQVLLYSFVSRSMIFLGILSFCRIFQSVFRSIELNVCFRSTQAIKRVFLYFRFFFVRSLRVRILFMVDFFLVKSFCFGFFFLVRIGRMRFRRM